MEIRIKRIYDQSAKSDGFRILVDRLWPRGIKKDTAHIDLWMKEAAPSTELRKWFDHDPAKWKAFQTKYRTELKKSDAMRQIRLHADGYPVLTLLYSAKNELYNQAAALKKLMDAER